MVGLGPAERNERNAWQSEAPGGALVDALPLRPFAALVSTLRLWVSGDTGPLHIARATGVPSVGVLLHPEGREALDPGPGFLGLYRPGSGPAPGEVLSGALELFEAGGTP